MNTHALSQLSTPIVPPMHLQGPTTKAFSKVSRASDTDENDEKVDTGADSDFCGDQRKMISQRCTLARRDRFVRTSKVRVIFVWRTFPGEERTQPDP